jgi:hypothetical protein
MAQVITEDHKRILREKGYTIEDMGKVWGKLYAGKFRFFVWDDFGQTQDSEDAAWADAWQYEPQRQAYLASRVMP